MAQKPETVKQLYCIFLGKHTGAPSQHKRSGRRLPVPRDVQTSRSSGVLRWAPEQRDTTAAPQITEIHSCRVFEEPATVGWKLYRQSSAGLASAGSVLPLTLVFCCPCALLSSQHSSPFQALYHTLQVPAIPADQQFPLGPQNAWI